MRLENSKQFSAEFYPNGSLCRLQHRQTLINLFPGNAVEGTPANLYLRLHEGAEVHVFPLLGPQSRSKYHCTTEAIIARGECGGFQYTVTFRLAEGRSAWFWHVQLQNKNGAGSTAADLIYVQDIALADYGFVRLNEHYVSQYIDYQPLEHEESGFILAVRQNLAMGGKHPWVLIGSLTKATSYATDALQITGRGGQGSCLSKCLQRELPGTRLQHEHSTAALQTERVVLKPGEDADLGFFALFEEDHPEASSERDLSFRTEALQLAEAKPLRVPEGAAEGSRQARSLFATATLSAGEELNEQELRRFFGEEQRLPEYDEAGKLLSYFSDSGRHVVLQSKEQAVLRPHGMIITTASGDTPNEGALTTTVWMSGIFNSMLTQGHVSINRFLSTNHSYLGLFRSFGQRIFVERDGKWFQLGLPSAFEMTPGECCWLYKFQDSVLELRNRANLAENCFELEVNVLKGPAMRFLISNHCALGGDDGLAAGKAEFKQDAKGVSVTAPAHSEVGSRFPGKGFRLNIPPDQLQAVGGDELLFEDGKSQQQPFICLLSKSTSSLKLSVHGELLEPTFVPEVSSGKEYWEERCLNLQLLPPADSELGEGVREIAAIFPWYLQNAYIHYLAPRGLEQYTGGGWGTRDVTQGPLEMLLALDRPSAVRDILRRVFCQQNPDGDWPQWFMFFERERNIRPADSHGDIVFWPLLALGKYLLHTNDASILEEKLPFFQPNRNSSSEEVSIREHVERALSLIKQRCVRDTALISYGHGDWNDSLQPYDESLKKELVSTWTVTLHYQTLRTLAEAFEALGEAAKAQELQIAAEAVFSDFKKHLLPDGVLTGFLRTSSPPSYMLHPRDQETGLHYSLLPYIHAILADMLSPEEAQRHLGYIRSHLLGADGARLFDRPLKYRGGLQQHFQRAESSSFFGREIGLMYTHAHLRYAEALAHLGEAELFFEALSLANPPGLKSLLKSAAVRQSNCYYSSSDACFSDRYEAHEQYPKVHSGEVEFEGGWRVYSSGGGIYVGLLLNVFLGLKQKAGRLLIDPIIARSLDGLTVRLVRQNTPLELVYRVDKHGFGPVRLILNGKELEFVEEHNPYRRGAASIKLKQFSSMLKTENRMEIYLA